MRLEPDTVKLAKQLAALRAIFRPATDGTSDPIPPQAGLISGWTIVILSSNLSVCSHLLYLLLMVYEGLSAKKRNQWNRKTTMKFWG